MSSKWEDLVEFFRNTKGNFFPEGTLFKAVHFYGPPISLPDGETTLSPCVTHEFDRPVTEDVVCAVVVATAKDGGAMNQDGFFIPWGAGVVYFERVSSSVDLSAGDPSA